MNCAKCNQLLDTGAQFCGNCGQPVVAATPASVSTPAPASPPVAQTVPAAAVSPQVIVAAGDPHANSRATAALVLGIMSMIAWLLPLIGLPISIIGLVMGILGRRSQQKGLAVAGIILASIGLAATIANGAAGVLLSEDDQSPAGLASERSVAVETACYQSAFVGDFTEVTTPSECTASAVNADQSAKFTLKTVDAPNVTAANLDDAARLDVKYVQSQTPGSVIESQGATTFAGQKAYQAVLKVAQDDQSAVIYYVFKPEGYLINGKTIKLFAFVYTTVGDDLAPMDELERHWAWR